VKNLRLSVIAFSPEGQFGLDRFLQRLLLLLAEIHGLIFPINRKESDLTIRGKVVVDDPQTAPLALSASWILPSELAETAGARHDIARLRRVQQQALEGSVAFVV